MIYSSDRDTVVPEECKYFSWIGLFMSYVLILLMSLSKLR